MKKCVIDHDGVESYIKTMSIGYSLGLSEKEYDDLWSLKPDKPRLINEAGEVLYTIKPVRRSYRFGYHRSFKLRSMPTPVERLFNYSKMFCPDLNNIHINWYDDDVNAIECQCYNTKQLVPNSEIWTWIFGVDGCNCMNIMRKGADISLQNHCIDFIRDTLVIQGGQCSNKYMYTLYTSMYKTKRIIITFRCFK